MKTYVLGMILMLLLACTEVKAQYQSDKEAGKIGIGAQIGYQRSGSADAGSLMYGGMIRAKLSPAFAIEGSLNYRTQEYYNGRLTVRSWPVMLSGLIYPFPPMLYGLVGVGWHNTTFDWSPGFQHEDLADPTKSRFGWHIGGGAEIPLGENFRLTGDIKYVFLDYKLNDVPDIPLSSLNSNFYVINIGILLGFH